MSADYFYHMIFRLVSVPLPLRLAAFSILLGIWGASPTSAQPDSTNGWGYPVDSLQVDIARWRLNPLMRVDSIGLSVQGRPIWRVTVGAAAQNAAPKPAIFVHARTHPAEVQSFYVLREMLGFVTDPVNDTAAALRRDFVWHFIPMYNPDGVVLGKARHNANGIDIESNWNKTVLEPEVAALKATFQSLSNSPATTPATDSANGTIRVALNLHSDQVNCTRFFFYHHENGTSPAYAELERTYITGVRSYFIEGIEPWNYVQSWSEGFVTQYPESFWWLTRGSEVMALTYEDTNCPGAGDFYRTGRALALGSADYLRTHPVMLVRGRTRALDARTGLSDVGLEQMGQGAGQGRVVVDRRDGKVVYRDVRGKILKVGAGE